jgi:hypothetical protein
MVQGEEVQLCLFAPSRSNGSVNEQTRTGPCRDTTGECDCACLYGKGTAPHRSSFALRPFPRRGYWYVFFRC